MQVLVTSLGVIGAGVVPELLRRAHRLRLLSPDAEDAAKEWTRVEPYNDLLGAASACDAIVHVESESAIETQDVIAEAKRAGVRLVLVGPNDSDIASTIVRPDVVYGPGDEVVSAILKAVRTLPAIPALDNGDQPFRPIWFEDFARELVSIIESDRTGVIDLAGTETTTLESLIKEFEEITARRPARLPVSLTFAVELPEVSPTAKTIEADMPLAQRLRILADSMPEVLPDEGVGKMHHKRFWADIAGSRKSAIALMSYFRDHVNDVMPIEFAAEPGAPSRIDLGISMTMHLPLRGNVQIRVERADPTHVVFATLDGHPLAGLVEFKTEDQPGGHVRFAVHTYTRPANLLDFLALRLLGERFQSANWRTVVQRMIDASGGTSDGVKEESQALDEAQAAAIQKAARSLVQERKREESAQTERPS